MRACLGLEDITWFSLLQDKGYELRETHDGHGVYVLIDHDEEEDVEAAAPVYNLYTCGIVNATLFSLSLERVFSVDFYGQRLADWHRVESLPGVFITNQLEVGAMSVETMRMRGWKNFVETQITFNGGGHWQHLQVEQPGISPPLRLGLTVFWPLFRELLRPCWSMRTKPANQSNKSPCCKPLMPPPPSPCSQAPETFRNEACNLCKKNEPCRLHLHGASSWVGGSDGRPSVYSHPSAPGILMASGNTGNHLDFNSDFQCTWLSRDGGYSWEVR